MTPGITGALVANRRTEAKFYRPSQEGAILRPRAGHSRVEHNPRSEWFVVEGAHKPIVDADTFDRAEARRAGRRRVD